MNFLIKKNVFIRGLSYVEGIVSRNANLPILANIHIGVAGKNVVLSATNLELGVVVSLPAQITAEGEAVLAPRILSSFLSQASDDVIQVSREGSSLTIKEQKRTATLQLEQDEEFPIIPRLVIKEPYIIPSLKFIPALERVINSASLSEAKPELAGVFLSIQSKELVLAATDGFRLSEARIAQQSSGGGTLQCILPIRCVQAIIKVFRGLELEGDVLIGYEDNQVVIQNEEKSVYLISKVIEGEYPAYTSIIPNDFITSCTLPKAEFLQQVKSAGLFASRANTIRVEIGGDKIHITSEEGDIGSFAASLDIQKEGEDCSLVFNHHYLIDGLQNIEGETISFKVSKKDGPALLSGVTNKNYLYLLMPIREV